VAAAGACLGGQLRARDRPRRNRHHGGSLVANPVPGVLHIAFDRTVAIGQVEDILHAAGAHVVTGPDSSGVFGIAPSSPDTTSGQMRALEARLRAEARVRWVEPLTAP
jgi:hypothetical protein